MKKYIIGLLAAWLLTGAAFAENIGFIDMQRILTTYQGAIDLQQDLQKQRDDYQKIVEEQQKKLEDAKKEEKSDEDIQKIIEDIQEELRPKQQMLIQYEAMKQQELLGKIISKVQVVRKEYGIDVVLDKQVVYDGGFDLTYFLIEKLNEEQDK